MIPETYNANLINHEAPYPDGNSVKSYVLQQKAKSKKMFPPKKTIRNKSSSSTPSPIIGKTFGLKEEK